MMSDQVSKHDQVLLALALNLQSIAMVQLGKMTSPASGTVERDLDAARGTIDILEMLKVKCRTDTAAPVVRMLDQAVMDLQMNYLDELKSERRKREQHQEAGTAPEREASGAAAGQAADDAEKDAGTPADHRRDSGESAEQPGTSQA